MRDGASDIAGESICESRIDGIGTKLSPGDEILEEDALGVGGGGIEGGGVGGGGFAGGMLLCRVGRSRSEVVLTGVGGGGVGVREI